jgi:S-methylmethionine-dependent homocysteine/selenocysteine methylase
VRKPFEKPVYIGGSFAPLEDCYRPDLVPDAATLTCEHFQMAGWLAEEGVDFLLPETINALSEACIMAKAAASTGLPFLISFVVDSEGRLLDGTPIAKAVAETNYPTRIGVALNCRPIDILDTAFKQLSATYKGSIALYPNGFGHPHDELGWTFENNDDSIDKFVATALKWHAAGARFIGGCCGTTPDYIRKLAAARAILENEKTPLQKQWA